jgi:hypothetical protein
MEREPFEAFFYTLTQTAKTPSITRKDRNMNNNTETGRAPDEKHKTGI